MQNVVVSTGTSIIDGLFDLHHETSISLRFSTHRERRRKLRALRNAIIERRERIEAALKADLNKPAEEALITEILPTLIELKFAYRYLPEWMGAKPIANTFPVLLGKSFIRYEPKGRVLVISPWNYPFHLAIAPLIFAIAAGNTVIIKPSEFSPNTGRVIREMIASVFDETEITVVEGGVDTARYLIEKPFDHIFFTGSPDKGKKVMAAAAENLTSVTLELGGKSPVIIDVSADITNAAQKIAWGKFINAGQTCIAPDYVLVPEHLQGKFTKALYESFKRYLGNNNEAGTYTSIISGMHFDRLTELLEKSIEHGADIEMFGESRSDDRFIPPAILTNVDTGSPVMKEEIFGPLLPVIPVIDTDEAIRIAGSLPKPLALYIFGKDRKRISMILDQTTSGGTCINDVYLHFANPRLPFGGVNQSGIGRYHGFHGFEELSNKRSIYKQSRLGYINLLYPPYTKLSRKLINGLMRYFSR